MQEMADSKISKTFDHDIANRMLDSMRAGLRNATFGNIAEKTQQAARHLEILGIPLISITFFPKL
jgi:hypothetical protein